jgi:hypothetical protein
MMPLLFWVKIANAALCRSGNDSLTHFAMAG